MMIGIDIDLVNQRNDSFFRIVSGCSYWRWVYAMGCCCLLDRK
jgi:hypothetical protein